MRSCFLLIAALASASAFMPPPSHLSGRVGLSVKSNALEASNPLFKDVVARRESIFETSHGGGIFIGNGGDGDNLGGGGGGDGDSSGKGGNPLAAFWRSYNRLLREKPLLTKALTSLVGFSLGDVLAQKFIDKKDEIDVKRLARLASFGFLIHGTTGHYFYNWLDNLIPGNGASQVAVKVGIDQLLWNPIFGTLFFGYMGFAEGKSVPAIKQRIQSDLFTQVKGSWTVWPIAHAINFRFIPTSQRLLYINTIQIGYNMFLSVLANKGASEQLDPVAPIKKRL